MADDEEDIQCRLRVLARLVYDRFGWVVRPYLKIGPDLGKRIIMDVLTEGPPKPVFGAETVVEQADESRKARNPSECERDILAVLLTAGRRLKGDEIKKQLDAGNTIHGDSTVNAALARMVKEGRLTNAKDGNGNGYRPE